MNKQQYIEKLRGRAQHLQDTGREEAAIGLESEAEYLESMDVVWVPQNKFSDWFELIDDAQGAVGRAAPKQRSEPEWNDLIRAKAALAKLDDEIDAAENTND